MHYLWQNFKLWIGLSTYFCFHSLSSTHSLIFHSLDQGVLKENWWGPKYLPCLYVIIFSQSAEVSPGSKMIARSIPANMAENLSLRATSISTVSTAPEETSVASSCETCMDICVLVDDYLLTLQKGYHNLSPQCFSLLKQIRLFINQTNTSTLLQLCSLYQSTIFTYQSTIITGKHVKGWERLHIYSKFGETNCHSSAITLTHVW